MGFSSKLLNPKDLQMICRSLKYLIAYFAQFAVAVACTQAQTAMAQSGTAAETAGKAAQPVLIIHANCPQEAKIKTKIDSSCDTVIREGKFDNLVAALDSKMPASNRLVLATEYVKLLIMAREAEQLKIDQDPEFRELEQFTRLQLLERQLVRRLEKESSAISQEEIAAYYQQHPAQFAEGSLRKIYIPKQGQWSTVEAAQSIQRRAARGEDFDALEREVWAAQGRTAGAPATRTGTLRRSALPEVEQRVFDLSPGEVSAPIDEPGAFVILKLEAKKELPRNAVEDEIRNGMAGERLQERINKLRSAVSVSVNEDYFGALPSTEELARHHGMEHAGSHLMPMSDTEKNRR